MPFATGDMVKPKPCWLHGPDSIPVPPAGRVRDVEALGRRTGAADRKQPAAGGSAARSICVHATDRVT
jgi:hypothetical protein